MRTSRRGQAAYEFAIAVFVFSFIVTLLVECAPMLSQNLRMLDTARADAGVAALRSTQGSRTTAMAAAGRIAEHARPERTWTPLGGADPWEYPVQALSSEDRFREWRDARPRPTSLCYGTAKDRFVVPVWFDAEGRKVEQEVHLSEEVFFPALGQETP